MAQLMPLPLTVSCFSNIQIGFTFLVPAYPCSPGKGAVKRVRVCYLFIYLFVFLRVYLFLCLFISLMSVAIVLLLLLAHLHKKSTQNERSKLHETRKKTQKISDQTTMMTGKDCSVPSPLLIEQYGTESWSWSRV